MADQPQTQLALGFIGGSLESAIGRTHFSAAVMDNLWSVKAGAFSRNEATNRQTAQAFGCAIAYDDWRQMLLYEQRRLDAVAVLTPIADHYPMVAAALAAGFPVICEKALVDNSADARALQALRDRYNGFLVVTYNYSGYPMVRELREMVTRGELGDILHFQAEMPQEGFIRTDPAGNRPRPQAWRLRDARVPTIYLDLAAHLHHLLWYVTGESPREVVADQASRGWFPGVVDDVNVLCRYTNGLSGQLWFSKAALGHRNGLRLRLYGSKAAAEWHQAAPEDLLISHVDGRREIRDRASAVQIADARRYTRFKPGHPAGFVEAFANLYHDIAESLMHYRATGKSRSHEAFSAELAYEGLCFLEAIQNSARTNAWQTVQTAPLSTVGERCDG